MLYIAQIYKLSSFLYMAKMKLRLNRHLHCCNAISICSASTVNVTSPLKKLLDAQTFCLRGEGREVLKTQREGEALEIN